MGKVGCDIWEKWVGGRKQIPGIGAKVPRLVGGFLSVWGVVGWRRRRFGRRRRRARQSHEGASSPSSKKRVRERGR